MSSSFDDWVRATLDQRHDARPRPGEVRRIIAGLQPRRARQRRLALTAGVAVVVFGLVLIASPKKIGGEAGRYEITRKLDDGRIIIQQPLTGAGTVVSTPEEIEKWNRRADKAASGEETIYSYAFYRYRGKEYWMVGYLQVDDEGKEEVNSRQPTYRPVSNLSVDAVKKIAPYLDQLEQMAKTRSGIACPSEGRDVDGVPVVFEVWALDIPDIGRVEYGVGKPPAQ
jgi:hypothetical protein